MNSDDGEGCLPLLVLCFLLILICLLGIVTATVAALGKWMATWDENDFGFLVIGLLVGLLIWLFISGRRSQRRAS